MSIDPHITVLRTKIATYGKENQEELLYALAEGARLLSGCERVRIYRTFGERPTTPHIVASDSAFGCHPGKAPESTSPEPQSPGSRTPEPKS